MKQLTYFHAPWCGICRIIKPRVEKAAALDGVDMKMVDVETDEGRDLSMKLGIMSLPTLIDDEGKRYVGGKDIPRYLKGLIDAA